MEKDNEPKGLGNSLDFGERMYSKTKQLWLDKLSLREHILERNGNILSAAYLLGEI